MCSAFVTLLLYWKIRYFMSLLRKPPPLVKDGYYLLSPSLFPRYTRKATFKSLNHTSAHLYLRDFKQEVKHFQVVRLCSSSKRDVFKPEPPIGIFEETQNRSHWNSLGGNIGQSFSQLSRHINNYFKNKEDVDVPLAENTSLDVPTPECLRLQRHSQSHKGKGTPQVHKCKDQQKSSLTGHSTLQLFHISTLASRFGESYSYVANHINSVFFKSFRAQETLQTISSTRGTQRRGRKGKMLHTFSMDSKDAKMAHVKLNADQGSVESGEFSSSWEEGYLHFARHINKYFGANVTDEVQNNRVQLPVKDISISKSTQSTSQTPGAKPQLKQKDPVTPTTEGFFHSSYNTINFGENYFQIARHINQHFMGQSMPDEDTDRNVLKPVPATSERTKAVTFMDCLRQPTSAIPHLLGSYLNKSLLTQMSKPETAMTSNETIMNKTHVLSRMQAEEITHGLIGSLRLASTPGALVACVESLNEHLICHPSCKALMWQEKTVCTLLKKRRSYKNDQALQSALRETLALIGYVDPVKGCGIRVLSIDGGGTRGVVPLHILQLLENETGRKIHQQFDYICGVSTGAALAFMLGLARFSVEECTDMYRRFCSEVFRQNPLVGTMKMGWSHSYYNTETWEAILREKLGNRVLIKTARDQLSPKVSAVSAVVNWGTSPKAFVFRNYNHKPGSLSRYAGGSGYQMWQAVRASSAAPGYFQEFPLQSDIHQDGGIIMNNPCALAVHESRLLWPNQPFQCVLSLGTGRYDNAKRGPATSTSLRAKISNLICSATDTEGVHTLLDDLLASDVYFRFNPMLSALVSLDENRPGALDQLDWDTRTYLERNRPKLARLCLVLGAERSAVSKTKDWMSARVWEMKQRWL